jgi:hypothetical protein
MLGVLQVQIQHERQEYLTDRAEHENDPVDEPENDNQQVQRRSSYLASFNIEEHMVSVLGLIFS